MKYTEDLIKKVNEIKDAAIALANKVSAQDDATTECGKLYAIISKNWKSIDSTIFVEEPSELELQIDAAIAQAYQKSA